MANRSILMDPNHVPQKKNKRITEFPNGKNMPKEMQAMVGNKGLILVSNIDLHNELVEVMNNIKPMLIDREYELYFIQAVSPNTLIYDNELEIIWFTKDSNPKELTPSFYE